MKFYLFQVHWTFCQFLILTRRRHQYSFSMKKLHDFVRAALSGSWFARSRVAPALLLQFQRCSLLPVLPALVLPSWSFSGPWLPTFLSLIVIALWCVVENSGVEGFPCANWSGRPAPWVLLESFFGFLFTPGGRFWRLSFPWLSLQCLLWLFWCKLVWQKQTSSMSLAWVQDLWRAAWTKIGGLGEMLYKNYALFEFEVIKHKCTSQMLCWDSGGERGKGSMSPAWVQGLWRAV